MKMKNLFLPICLAMALVSCSSDDSSGTAETCETPTGLTATNITETAANLGWSEMGSATTWDVEFGQAGFVATGEPTAPNVSNPYAATGLTAETAYEFYVRADCGATESDWAGPFAFSTSITENQKNYMPLAEANAWSYHNVKTGGGLPTTESDETMTAGAPTEQNSMLFYPMMTDNPNGAGFVTNLLSNGTLHQDGGNVVYDGTIVIVLEQLQMDPVEIAMDNATIISNTAAAGTELFTYSGSETQNLNIGVPVPVTMNYTATTTNAEFLPSFTASNGEVYEDVLRATLVVSASAVTEYNGLPITILAEQDVIISTNYYANEIGMIQSDVLNNIEFEDLSSFGLPVIPNVHIESSQELTAHVLN